MKILLTGATGLVGKKLGQELVRNGHEVTVVTRNKISAQKNLPFSCQIIEADLVHSKIEADLLKNINGVFHLMGESVAGARWSEKQKNIISASRINSTKNLIQSLSNTQLDFFVSASAIGFYGDQKDMELTERSHRGNGFLAELCESWELETKKVNANKVTQLRFGLVLSTDGGALKKMLPAFRAGIGGDLGDGQHWMSWIHIDDVIGACLHVMKNQDLIGAVNVVSPEPVRNHDFTRIFAKVLKKTTGPRVPAFALKILFGEMSSILLESQKVVPEKLLKTKYQFLYSSLEAALNDISGPV